MRASNAQKLADFTSAGCRFFGSKQHIFEFEHLADLILALKTEGFDDLQKHQILVVQTQHGLVAAFNRAGWPTKINEWTVREVLALVTNRTIQHFSVSELALRIDEEQRAAQLKAMEERVARRLTTLRSRLAEDVGPNGTSIYVIGSRAQTHAKIGISDNPLKRRASLQTGNPSQLIVHSSFWLFNREHASILEKQTHRALKARGNFLTGEWFNVEPAIAERIISEVYDELIERQIIVEDHKKISDGALDAELLEHFCTQVSWRYSKKGNLKTTVFGVNITVFYKHKTWRWVRDGSFSHQEFTTSAAAQRDAIRSLTPSRDQMLSFLRQNQQMY